MKCINCKKPMILIYSYYGGQSYLNCLDCKIVQLGPETYYKYLNNNITIYWDFNIKRTESGNITRIVSWDGGMLKDKWFNYHLPYDIDLDKLNKLMMLS
jgi:hypothetical protein